MNAAADNKIENIFWSGILNWRKENRKNFLQRILLPHRQTYNNRKLFNRQLLLQDKSRMRQLPHGMCIQINLSIWTILFLLFSNLPQHNGMQITKTIARNWDWSMRWQRKENWKLRQVKSKPDSSNNNNQKELHQINREKKKERKNWELTGIRAWRVTYKKKRIESTVCATVIF